MNISHVSARCYPSNFIIIKPFDGNTVKKEEWKERIRVIKESKQHVLNLLDNNEISDDEKQSSIATILTNIPDLQQAFLQNGWEGDKFVRCPDFVIAKADLKIGTLDGNVLKKDECKKRIKVIKDNKKHVLTILDNNELSEDERKSSIETILIDIPELQQAFLQNGWEGDKFVRCPDFVLAKSYLKICRVQERNPSICKECGQWKTGNHKCNDDDRQYFQKLLKTKDLQNAINTFNGFATLNISDKKS